MEPYTSRLSAETRYPSDTSPWLELCCPADEVGDVDSNDGSITSPRPLALFAEPDLEAEPERAPFNADRGTDCSPTRAIARRSISPDLSRAIRKRANSAQSSQSPFCEARPISRTTYSSMRLSRVWLCSSSSKAWRTSRYPTAVFRESSFKACSKRSLGGGR